MNLLSWDEPDAYSPASIDREERRDAGRRFEFPPPHVQRFEEHGPAKASDER